MLLETGSGAEENGDILRFRGTNTLLVLVVDFRRVVQQRGETAGQSVRFALSVASELRRPIQVLIAMKLGSVVTRNEKVLDRPSNASSLPTLVRKRLGLGFVVAILIFQRLENLVEQRVQELSRLLDRTEIPAKLFRRLDVIWVGCVEILTGQPERGHVGPAEAVDTLFFVTDEEDVLCVEVLDITCSEEFDEIPL
jgi:hypothetical protein